MDSLGWGTGVDCLVPHHLPTLPSGGLCWSFQTVKPVIWWFIWVVDVVLSVTVCIKYCIVCIFTQAEFTFISRYCLFVYIQLWNNTRGWWRNSTNKQKTIRIHSNKYSMQYRETLKHIRSLLWRQQNYFIAFGLFYWIMMEKFTVTINSLMLFISSGLAKRKSIRRISDIYWNEIIILPIRTLQQLLKRSKWKPPLSATSTTLLILCLKIIICTEHYVTINMFLIWRN